MIKHNSGSPISSIGFKSPRSPVTRDLITSGSSTRSTLQLQLLKPIPNGKLRVFDRTSVDGSGVTETRVVRRETIDLNFEVQRETQHILEVVEGIRDLVSIATQRRSKLERIILSIPELVIAQEDRTVHRAVELYIRQMIEPEPRSGTLNGLDLLFSVNDLGGLAAINPWRHAAEKYSFARINMMSTVYAPPRFIEQKAVTRLAAFEDFHRK